MNKTKPQIYLFTDGSVNPQAGIGFGAYLLLEKKEFLCVELENKIKIKKFDNTSSTKLELETLKIFFISTFSLLSILLTLDPTPLTLSIYPNSDS